VLWRSDLRGVRGRGGVHFVGAVPRCLEAAVCRRLARREPSALEGWILEILHCAPKGSRAFLRILSTEDRVVRLCWALSKSEGPKGPSHREGAPG